MLYKRKRLSGCRWCLYRSVELYSTYLLNLFPDAVFFAGMGERVFFELSGIIIEEIAVQYVADAN